MRQLPRLACSGGQRRRFSAYPVCELSTVLIDLLGWSSCIQFHPVASTFGPAERPHFKATPTAAPPVERPVDSTGNAERQSSLTSGTREFRGKVGDVARLSELGGAVARRDVCLVSEMRLSTRRAGLVGRLMAYQGNGCPPPIYGDFYRTIHPATPTI